jgi:hypothetical protein
MDGGYQGIARATCEFGVNPAPRQASMRDASSSAAPLTMLC